MRHVVAVHEAVVGVIVAQSGNHNRELLQVTEPKLNREAIRTVLEQQVSHLRHVQVVKVVMIAQVVRVIDCPDGLKRGPQDSLIDLG